jgi:hypothetical protein
MKNKIIILLIISIITMQLPIGTVFAQGNFNWMVNQVSTDLYGLGVTCHENSFIAVGKKGSIKLSSDGTTWENETSGVTTNLNAVAWGNGQYVAVGDAGVILASKDGKKWIQAAATVKSNINGITWTGKQYIAVGDEQTILTSSDGLSWKSVRNQQYSQSLKAIAWNGTQYVAVGDIGTILTSENGSEWTKQDSKSTNLLNSVIWAQNQFIVVGSQKTILTSADGLNWTNQVSYSNYLSYYSVAWNGKEYIAVGNYGNIATSEDGINWNDNQSSLSNDAPLYGIVSSNDKFIAVGLSRTVSIVPTTTGGTLAVSSLVAKDLYGTGIIFNNGKYVAIGKKGVLEVSNDGLSWNKKDTSVSTDLYGITYGKNQYVAVGAAGKILTSKNGDTWAQQNSQTKKNLHSVAWSGNTYVAAGSSGTILVSNDGVTWKQPQLSSIYEDLYSVIWNGSDFMMFGSRNVWHSKNGTNWVSTSMYTPMTYNQICFGNKKYAAVNQYGQIATSYDGIKWTTKSILGIGFNSFSSVIWTGKQFSAAGSMGMFFTSTDGETWTKQITGTDKWIGNIVWDGSRYVAVTNGGILIILNKADSVLNNSEKPAYSKSFNDLPQGHWAYQAVMGMAGKGIISGYSDGTFRPNGVVTRGEFAKMMVLALDLPTYIPYPPTFKDVSSDNWAYTYVESTRNYIAGYNKSDGTYYKTNDKALREDMACALVKAKGLQYENYQYKNADVSKLNKLFSDANKIAPDLKRYVLIAYENNIIKGYSDNTFKPMGTLTRAEAASLLYKMSSNNLQIKVDEID